MLETPRKFKNPPKQLLPSPYKGSSCYMYAPASPLSRLLRLIN
jgi:hypothetical protein